MILVPMASPSVRMIQTHRTTTNRPALKLRLYLPNDGSADGSVGSGSELEVTLTLGGATFGQAIDWTAIGIVQPSTVLMDSPNLVKVGGSQQSGRRGEDHVKLRVMIPDEDGRAIIQGEAANIRDGNFMKSPQNTGYAITFDIGSLLDFDGSGSATASASFRVTDGPDNNFPTGPLVPRGAVAEVEGVDTTDDMDFTDEGDTAPVTAAPCMPGTCTSNLIASSANAVMFAAADGSAAGQIDLDDRASFDGTTTSIEVASLSYMTNVGAMEADGKTSFAEDKGMEANVTVTVSGVVRASDVIWFNQDGDRARGSREILTINGGDASRTFRISNITDADGNPTGAGTSVYFQPNGDDDMTDGSITRRHSLSNTTMRTRLAPDVESGMVSN